MPYSPNFATRRLYSQQIANVTRDRPGDVVAWLGAVQAQDYLGALWAVGLRTQHATEAAIERAIADRMIVRTWPMRGTLHFVAPPDVRWLLALSEARMIARSAGRFQALGLDDATIARCRDVCIRALQGSQRLTRRALYQAFEAAAISVAGQRGIHILWRLAQEALICFGPREGKQHTFVLLDKWTPSSRTLAREEALAELSARYFTSHGPATVQDFVWWSGLTTADARLGIALAGARITREVFDGQVYWQAAAMPPAPPESSGAHLLPAFDEYTVGYRDRGAVLDPAHAKQVNLGGGMLNPVIVIDGRVVGTWKRALTRTAVTVTLAPFDGLNPTIHGAVAAAASRYGAFLGLPVQLGDSTGLTAARHLAR
jgi:hypothetical protein